MYTIKQAAARSGVSIPTIRAWERRYGVVAPARTAAGYRLYDDEALARLEAMRRLVEEAGWRPSQAAERVRAAGSDLPELRATDQASPVALAAGDSPATRPADAAVEGFVRAARDLDVGRMEEALDEAFAAQRFELAMQEVVFPALRAVGDGWSTGEIDVAAEHAASETVRRRLSQFHDASGRSSHVPTVLVGLPPGSHHEIGAFAFAVAARRAGLAVLYLGADVPLESWLRTARETGAATVVLGVMTEADVASAARVVKALRTLPDHPACHLGGPMARDVPQAPGAAWLPDSIDGAVEAVRASSDDRGSAPG